MKLATTMRQKVERLEETLKHLPQVECPTRMLYAPHVAMREMIVPAGVTATGAVHKTEHRTIVVGRCVLVTGEGTVDIDGYANLLSKPGVKRAIVAITETIVTTIHPTDETDESKLAEMLTESTKDELLGGSMNKQLLANKAKELQ